LHNGTTFHLYLPLWIKSAPDSVPLFSRPESNKIDGKEELSILKENPTS